MGPDLTVTPNFVVCCQADAESARAVIAKADRVILGGMITVILHCVVLGVYRKQRTSKYIDGY